MDDTISRQQAIDAILHITNCKSVRELFEYNQEHHLTEMWSGGVNDAIDAVIGVESATDKNVGTKDAEPEIIRCEDCKYWDTTWQNDYAPNYHYCPMIDGTRRNDFYCAYAERKEERRWMM